MDIDMSIMYRNSNTGIEKELAIEEYRAHKARNRMAVLAVTLTTILITLIFTVGLSLVRTVSLAVTAAPGPGADGNCVYGDEEVLEKVRALPQVDWAAHVKRCSSTYLHNREFAGVEVRLFAADKVHYEKNMVDLITGKYPEKENEILLSDTMSKRLGLEEEVGISYPLMVVVRENGEDVEKEISMNVCGYYNNPLRNVKEIYEEIYTDESFISVYNPELSSGRDIIYVKLNNLDFFRFGHDKYEKLEEVANASGASSSGYKMSNMGAVFIIPVFLIVFLVMLCGYFFIYNIFDISITNDIRFYGELKTIGMTSGQLRRMLFIQMNRIAWKGIAAGSLIGFGTGKIAGREIICSFAEGVKGYYQTAGVLEVFVLGAFFSWVTVYISTMKPFRAAGNISPVEAVRYRGKRKKGIFSILSFSLSGILFLAVYTLSIGYRVDVMRERYNETDFRISHKGSMWSLDEAYQPISRKLAEELAGLPFAENFRIYYQARTKPDYVEVDGEAAIYLSSTGEIGKNGEIARDVEAYNEGLKEEGAEKYYYGIRESERGNYQLEVLGMDAEYLTDEEKYFKVLEGELDEKKFASGNYMIYQRKQNGGRGITGESGGYQVHAGDEVEISFYDADANRYVEKKFTVLAIIAEIDPFSTSNIQNANIILTDEAFRSIYSGCEDYISKICFDGNGHISLEEEREEYEAIQKAIGKDGNLQLYFQSKYEDEVHFNEEKRIIGAIGMFIAGIVGLIGISNVMNTVATELSARRLEYAAMQSIGMTKRQMEMALFGQYARYVFSAVGLAAAVGAPLTYALGLNYQFTGFSLPEFLQALALLLVFSILLCGAMAHILTKAMNRKSVVERLREVA